MDGPELRRLLRSLFSLAELERFLSGLPGGDDLVAGIPGRASLEEAAHVAAFALERRGQVDRRLMAALLAERPERAEDIQQFAVSRGFRLPLAEEVEILLGRGFDATVRARLSEAARGTLQDRGPLHESMLTLAELAALRTRDDVVGERTTLASRVQDLVGQVDVGPGVVRSPGGIEARAAVIFDEIMAAIQVNEGERAALRLLDLIRLRGGSREATRRAILLSAEVHAWRAAHGSLHAAPQVARTRWMELLRELLSAADDANGRPGRSSTDATTGRDMAMDGGVGGPLAVFRGRGINKRYARGSRFQLQGVDLELRPGLLVGVVGPNGAGKTTLLRVVAGELAADAGTLAYPALDGPRGELDWLRIRGQIGVVHQRLTPWHGSLVDNLHVWAARHGLRGQQNADAVEYSLGRLRLAEHRDAAWAQLSGGFRTRFELARVLLPRPRLLVLDEPLAPLDVVAQQRFLRDLRDLGTAEREPPAILISSQHIHEIEAVADEILYLGPDGQVEFAGHPGALADDLGPQVFELSGDLRPEVCDALARRFGPSAIQAQAQGIVLRAANDTDLEQLVALVHAAGGALVHVRNISGSVMRLFREAAR